MCGLVSLANLIFNINRTNSYTCFRVKMNKKNHYYVLFFPHSVNKMNFNEYERTMDEYETKIVSLRCDAMRERQRKREKNPARKRIYSRNGTIFRYEIAYNMCTDMPNLYRA